MSVVGMGLLLSSCVDLDSDKYFADRTTLESVFEDKTQSEEWLAYAYSFLSQGNVEVGSKGDTGGTGPSWNPFCFDDDMFYGDRDNSPGFGSIGNADWANYNSFHEGNYDENISQGTWERCYKGIYQASVFIHNIYRNKELSADRIIEYRGQARFVRAYYYWLLLRKYGPVPIMPDEGVDYTDSYDDLAQARNTYEEVVEYISSEMIQAAKEISAYAGGAYKRDEGNIGRPTVGACLATRAIAYIYAASPLMNGQLANGEHPAGVNANAAEQLRNFDGKPLLTLQYDESKWARAAAACKDVMELGVYQLYHHAKIDVPSDWMAITVEPYDDGDFSTKNWPDGYADIDPRLSYRDIFNGTVSAHENPEFIFGRVNNHGGIHNFSIMAMVGHALPSSLRGWNTHGLTQKMVDAYYMQDGTDAPGARKEWGEGDGSERPTGFTTSAQIRNGDFPELLVGNSKTLGANTPMMYVGREPRFYASVGFNMSVWENQRDGTVSNRNKQVSYYRNDGNGYLNNNFQYLRTGIGIKKFYNPNDLFTSNPNGDGSYGDCVDKPEIAIRYADILLLYAEALNELDGSYQIASWDGSTTYTISRDVNEMKKGLRPVRCRAGLPDFTAAEYASKSALRSKIKRERMIEFLGEGKRYFDLRRWMDAPIEEAKTVFGLDVFQDKAHRDDFMQVVPVTTLSAVFSDKMYFWPISHAELKRNKLLTQNPGWTYND